METRLPSSQEPQLNTAQLALDLCLTPKTAGYGQRYTVALLAPTSLVPFRAYLRYQRKWWPVEINFATYPFPTGWLYAEVVTIHFTQVIPPCPEHRDSWHPNISGADNGRACFSGVFIPAGNGIMNLLEALSVFLRNPNHPGFGNCSR